MTSLLKTFGSARFLWAGPSESGCAVGQKVMQNARSSRLQFDPQQICAGCALNVMILLQKKGA